MRTVNLAGQTTCVLDGQTLQLAGKLTISSVGELFSSSHKAIFNHPITTINCEEIKQADSSCLALLVYLQTHNDALEIVNLPVNLQTLVNLYDLQNVLHIKEGFE